MKSYVFDGRGPWTDALVSDFVEAYARPGPDPMDVCLAGGLTPEPFYRALASMPLSGRAVRLWLGDERFAPEASEDRNYRMIARAFSSCRWSPPPAFKPWPSSVGREAACAAYAADLASAAGDPPRFALAYFGIGADGHVAGLFPGDPALEEARSLASPSMAPAPPRERMTLTLRAFAGAERIRILARGQAKEAVASLLASDPGSLVAGRLVSDDPRFYYSRN